MIDNQTGSCFITRSPVFTHILPIQCPIHNSYAQNVLHEQRYQLLSLCHIWKEI